MWLGGGVLYVDLFGFLFQCFGQQLVCGIYVYVGWIGDVLVVQNEGVFGGFYQIVDVVEVFGLCDVEMIEQVDDYQG